MYVVLHILFIYISLFYLFAVVL